MDLYDLLQDQIGMFLLVLTRVSAIFIIAPFFGSRNIPITLRVAASVAITLVVFPLVVQMGIVKLPETLLGYMLVVFTELLIGWCIGFVASLTFSAIHMAGQLLDMQVGFGVVNVLDPSTGQQVPIIGSFKYNLAIIVFLVTNSHHFLITALFESFKMIPIMGAAITPKITELLVDLTGATFVTALKISIPILAAILLTDVALGVLARTMPQMNIFVVGIPAKIFVGLFVLSFALPFYILFLDVAFNEIQGNVLAVLRTLQ